MIKNLYKSNNLGQETDKPLKKVNRTEYRIKRKLSIKIGHIGSILNSRIHALKRVNNTKRKDHTKSMTVKKYQSHENDPHVAQGKTRSHTFFLVR